MNNEKTFTQDEVNTIVKNRLSEERAKYTELSGYKEKFESLQKTFGDFTKEAARKDLEASLKENRAVDPSSMAGLLMGKVTIDEAGKATYTTDKGEKMTIGEGVKAFLSDKPWAVSPEKPKFVFNGFHPGEASTISPGAARDMSIRKAMGLKDV